MIKNKSEVEKNGDHSILFIPYKTDIYEIKIDNEDAVRVAKYQWRLCKVKNLSGVVTRFAIKALSNTISLRDAMQNRALSRFIFNCNDDSLLVKTIDGDEFNLRKSNLEAVSQSDHFSKIGKENLRKIFPISTIYYKKPTGTNTSAMYLASIETERGIKRTKTFSIEKYGDKTAKELANAWLELVLSGKDTINFDKERPSKANTRKNIAKKKGTNINIIEKEGDHSVLIVFYKGEKIRFMIDDDVVNVISKYHWCISGSEKDRSLQARTAATGNVSIRKTILNLKQDQDLRIKLKNKNFLDLRKSNLEVCEKRRNLFTPTTLKVTEICRDSQGKARYREKVINPEGEVLSKKEIEVPTNGSKDLPDLVTSFENMKNAATGEVHTYKTLRNSKGILISRELCEQPKDISSPMLSLDDERERKDKIRETRKMKKKENFTFESMSIGQLYCEIENNPRKYNGTTWEVLSMVGLVFSKGDPLHKYENVNEFTIREDRPVVFDKLTKHERIAFFPISTIVKRQEKWEEVSVMEGIQAFKEGKRIRVSHLLHNICDVFDGKETSKLPIDILEAMNYKWEIWR